MAHALLGEEAPAARLRAVGEEARVGAVHRDAEREREVAFELRRVERDEVRAVGIGNEPADLLEQPRPLEQLRGQRPRRAVERRHEVQALPRVRRDDARQQAEVVVDDARVNGLRRHVDQPRARLPQQQQQEEEALLVRLDDRGRHVRVLERHRAARRRSSARPASSAPSSVQSGTSFSWSPSKRACASAASRPRSTGSASTLTARSYNCRAEAAVSRSVTLVLKARLARESRLAPPRPTWRARLAMAVGDHPTAAGNRQISGLSLDAHGDRARVGAPHLLQLQRRAAAAVAVDRVVGVARRTPRPRAVRRPRVDLVRDRVAGSTAAPCARRCRRATP